MREALMKQPRTIPGINGYKYKQQFGVIIVCPTEQEQQATFLRLKALGYKVRVVCV